MVAPLSAQRFGAGEHPLPRPAPFAAATTPVTGITELGFTLGSYQLIGRYDPGTGRTCLDVRGTTGSETYRSRRHGRVDRRHPATEIALVLTGRHLALATREDRREWVFRARVDLRIACVGLDPFDEQTMSGLRLTCPNDTTAGGFGQLGLRDIRLLSTSDGLPVRDGDRVLLSATHAGPGFFDTGHTGIWSLHPETFELVHRADLFFRRPGIHRPGVYGDHAVHVVRHHGEWLVAASTWSDFDLAAPRIRATLARPGVEVTTGEHVLDAEPLELPTDTLDSVGVWDPHLTFDGERWLVGYVSAQRFFRFHPALAAGDSLDSLRLLGAQVGRTATEGTTLARLDGRWRVLASDGTGGRRGQRQRYPVFDLAMREIDELHAPHPSNIPWPTLLPHGEGWLMIGFDGTTYGGGLLGLGTHGDVLISASRPR